MAGKGTGRLTARGQAMQRVLARWERSGLTLAEFAQRAGVPPGTLGWWRHMLRAGTRTPGTGRFVELPVRPALADAPGHSTPAPFEVVLGTGTVVRVPAAFDAAALERLLALVSDRRGC